MNCWELQIYTVDWGEGGLFCPWQFSIEDEARAKLDGILEPFETNTTWFFENVGKGLAADNCAPPWALLVFPRPLKLMAYCLTLQRFAPNLLFTSYDQKPDWKIVDGLPKVSIALVPDKNSLELIGENSPLFSGAWNDTKANAGTKRWLCIPELPDETWINDNEAIDDLIFKRDFLKNS